MFCFRCCPCIKDEDDSPQEGPRPQSTRGHGVRATEKPLPGSRRPRGPRAYPAMTRSTTSESFSTGTPSPTNEVVTRHNRSRKSSSPPTNNSTTGRSAGTVSGAKNPVGEAATKRHHRSRKSSPPTSNPTTMRPAPRKTGDGTPSPVGEAATKRHHRSKNSPPSPADNPATTRSPASGSHSTGTSSPASGVARKSPSPSTDNPTTTHPLVSGSPSNSTPSVYPATTHLLASGSPGNSTPSVYPATTPPPASGSPSTGASSLAGEAATTRQRRSPKSTSPTYSPTTTRSPASGHNINPEDSKVTARGTDTTQGQTQIGHGAKASTGSSKNVNSTRKHSQGASADAPQRGTEGSAAPTGPQLGVKTVAEQPVPGKKAMQGVGKNDAASKAPVQSQLVPASTTSQPIPPPQPRIPDRPSTTNVPAVRWVDTMSHSAIKTEIENTLNTFITAHNLTAFFSASSHERHLTQAAALAQDPPPTLPTREDILDLTTVSLYETIIYCDDSNSMHQQAGQRIAALKEAVKRVTRIATMLDPTGVKVRFMNYHSERLDNICTEEDVNRIMKTVNFRGRSSDLGTQLRARVLGPLLYEQHNNGGGLKRPLFITIITDGMPIKDNISVRDALLECRDFLAGAGYEPKSVVFQVTQVGNAGEAQDFITSLHEEEDIRKMVYCTSEKLDERMEVMRKNKANLDRWILDLLVEGVRL